MKAHGKKGKVNAYEFVFISFASPWVIGEFTFCHAKNKNQTS